MYLHLGQDIVINEKKIVAVFDLDHTSVSALTRGFLRKAEEKGEVILISEEDLPKSYLVCEENGRQQIYLSPISSATLLKRSGQESL